jgi:hypothetical protein
MAELPPEFAVEPEPTDTDPPPEALRSDRPRIWPEEPRAPRPQVKRPMDEWLVEFEARVKDSESRPREPASRRRRPRGLARILPVPARADRPRPERVVQEPSEEVGTGRPRRGRRRRRGSGRGAAASGAQPAQPSGRTSRQGPPRPRGSQPRRPQPGRDRRPGPDDASPPQNPSGGDQSRSSSTVQGSNPHGRRRRRGRGRGRGPRPNAPPNSGGSAGPSPPPPS